MIHICKYRFPILDFDCVNVSIERLGLILEREEERLWVEVWCRIWRLKDFLFLVHSIFSGDMVDGSSMKASRTQLIDVSTILVAVASEDSWGEGSVSCRRNARRGVYLDCMLNRHPGRCQEMLLGPSVRWLLLGSALMIGQPPRWFLLVSACHSVRQTSSFPSSRLRATASAMVR